MSKGLTVNRRGFLQSLGGLPLLVGTLVPGASSVFVLNITDRFMHDATIRMLKEGTLELFRVPPGGTVMVRDLRSKEWWHKDPVQKNARTIPMLDRMRWARNPNRTQHNKEHHHGV